MAADNNLNPQYRDVDRESVQISVDEPVIEGGEIRDIDPSQLKADPIKKQKVLTARTLAYILIGILTLSVVAHYSVTVWLLQSENGEVVDITDRIFNSWLPVISGFAGAAVTYFFTREK
jgi:nitrate reductase NapE component